MTGADGFVGSNILQFMLNNTDWEFTVICSWRHKGNPLNVPLSNRVNVITHDLRGPIPEIGAFDYILHLASDSHVDRSISDPVNFVENNISITLQTLEYARKHMPTRFVMFSTDEVYGANQHNDWDLLLPTNPYAASKGAEELLSIAYFNTYKIPVIITNSNNIIGPNQDPEKFVPKAISLIKAGKTVDIHSINKKYGKRCYNPVQNIASALVFILGQAYESAAPTMPARYALAGGKTLDNLEMANLIAEMLGKKLKYRSIDVTTLRPTYDAFYAEGDEKLKDMGWKPPYSLREGLRWIKSQ